MRPRLILTVALLWSVPLAGQMSARSDAGSASNNEAEMLLPPPVNGRSFPTQYRAEQMSNYFRGRMRVDSSYVQNLYAGTGATSVNETTISILPTFTFDRESELQRLSISYSPGYTSYRPTSALNELDQSAVVSFQRNLTLHSTLSINDGFVDSSTSFGFSNLATAGGIQGVPVSVTPGIIPPFTQRLTNVADAEVTVQTGRNTMIGASGLVTLLHYPNQSQTPGLYDGTSRGGSAFYSHRLTRNQYAGLIYTDMDMLTDPASVNESDTRVQDASVFYTIYLASQVPLSIVAGPQHYHVTQSGTPTLSSWVTSLAASIGWQGEYVSYALSYSQSVTGAGGLFGAFRSKSGTAQLRWRIAPSWSAGLSGQYANNRTVGSNTFSNIENGHTLGGSVAVEHSIGAQLGVSFEYDRLHASYVGIPSFLNNPDSNRGTVSLWWQFTRPFGR